MTHFLPHSREFWPHTVYVTTDAKGDALTKRVLSRLSNVRVIELDERADPITELGDSGDSDAENFTRGKRVLLLTRHHGGWLEHCPGTKEHVCCNLYTVNPGEGCPLDCTYCYLQSYLRRNPAMKLFTNTWDMLASIEETAAAYPERLYRVGTGEVIDSLVWDELTDLTLELVPFFARVPNAMLELRTKFDSVENLVRLRDEHHGKTVVAWSVNAPRVCEKDEAFTAPLDARIAAARRVVDAGYRVGFHFDPLIHFEGFEDEYRDTVERIFREIPAERIAWVSVSTLRYKRDMQPVMIERFPLSRVPFGEQIVGADNKLRYIQPLRMKLINFVWRELKARSESLPVYMCMESSAVWREVHGGPPAAGAELVEVFSKKGRLPIVQDVGA